MNNKKDYIIRNDDLQTISFDENGIRVEATRIIPVDCRNGYGLFENAIDGTIPKKYIINKNATILFWGDGTKTVIKRRQEDEYNKKLAFLIAYFQKRSGLSKTQANKFLDNLMDENEIKFTKLMPDLSKTLANVCESISNGFKNMAKNLKKGDEDK